MSILRNKATLVNHLVQLSTQVAVAEYGLEFHPNDALRIDDLVWLSAQQDKYQAVLNYWNNNNHLGAPGARLFLANY